jgi:hypothetical protein
MDDRTELDAEELLEFVQQKREALLDKAREKAVHQQHSGRVSKSSRVQ